jgi:hypothetical protein
MDISREQKFYYLIISIATVWFFNTAYQPNISFVVGVACIVAYVLYDTTTGAELDTNTNTSLINQLDALLPGRTPPAFFYLEPDFITFFYSIKHYEKFSMDSYFKAIKCTNNMLRFAKELEYDSEIDENEVRDSWKNFGRELPRGKTTVIKNGKSNFQQAEIQGFKALGYIRSFEITLPVSLKENHIEATKRFHVLMKRTLDKIRFHYRKYDKTVGDNYGLPRAPGELVDTFVPNMKI